MLDETNVPFFDALIENKNDLLATSLYHNEITEPYIVPLKSDNPRHALTDIINFAVLFIIYRPLHSTIILCWQISKNWQSIMIYETIIVHLNADKSSISSNNLNNFYGKS